jgi:hypothetical protein
MMGNVNFNISIDLQGASGKPQRFRKFHFAVALCIGAVDENRLDVDDRRAIDGFDRSDAQAGSGDLAHGHAM